MITVRRPVSYTHLLLDGIEKYYSKYTPMSEEKAGITLATLGNDAGIYGAARLILDS